MKFEDGTIRDGTACQPQALPRSRVYTVPGHYEKILQKADLAGMLTWTAVKSETTATSMLADAITMTSFAVTKNDYRDRLISWPRIQNLLFLTPPPVSLPDPSIFTRLRVTGKGKLSGFYLDIENMFHNIRLPSHLIKFFLLSKVRFGNLPAQLQMHLVSVLGYRLHQGDLVRPYQSTLPMGFKWAVYVAHSISKSAIDAAVTTFKMLAPQITNLKLGKISYANETSGLQRINKGDALVLHIVDDVNFVADSWPRKAVVILHQLVVGEFFKRQLPIKKAKSLPLQEVEKDSLPFIGWQWDLKAGLIMAQEPRLANAIACVSALLTQKKHRPQDFESAVGRLIWQSLGHRPLLASLCSVFKLRYSRASFASLENLIKSARKELAICATLSPLVKINVHRPYYKTIICIDASEYAGAVVYSCATEVELETLLDAWLKYTKTHLMIHKLKYLALVRSFVTKRVWKIAFSHTWTKREHINGLEAESYILALQWITTLNASSQRVVILFDS